MKKILCIDNYDSFIYNLVDDFLKFGCNVKVYRNNITSIDDIIESFNPDLILISPGPSSPKESGITVKLIRKYYNRIPIFGVCLGHQSIAYAFGYAIRRARVPVHGKTSPIYHDNKGIFSGVRNPMHAGRYHSLITDDIGSDFAISAKTKDGTIMALRHKKYPLESVQFHPESILTPDGEIIIKNILNGISKKAN